MKIRSSKCSGGNCVEVDKVSTSGKVIVYDEFGNRCIYSSQEWIDFIEGVKAGEFDIG